MVTPIPPYSNTSFTLPISPLSKRTLIPWGWVGDFVRMSFTIPSVNFPDRWFFFNTIRTDWPGFIFTRFVAFMTLIPLPPKGRNSSRQCIFLWALNLVLKIEIYNLRSVPEVHSLIKDQGWPRTLLSPWYLFKYYGNLHIKGIKKKQGCSWPCSKL